MRITFLCPPADKLNGGIKYIFRMAEALQADGFPAVVAEQNQRHPDWFSSGAKLVGYDALSPRPDEILVLPEDQPELLRTLATWPQRKIVYCQNHFYAAIGALGCTSFADFGISAILCGSVTIQHYCTERHAGLPTYLVPCAIDTARFKPSHQAKAPEIALVPRKRPIEAIYLQDMFRHSYPQWHHIAWSPLDNLPESALAERLGQAALFLSLSRLDGFGLTPLEAMAAGCVVAGFTGIGGQEYAAPQNGFWTAEDDFPACLQALDAALTLWQTGGAPLAAYQANAQATVARYTPQAFAAAVRDAWTSMLHA